MPLSQIIKEHKVLSKAKSWYKIFKRVKNWRTYSKAHYSLKEMNDSYILKMRTGENLWLKSVESHLLIVDELYFWNNYDMHNFKHLKPEIVFDFGGFNGITTIFFAKRFPKSNIHVFEPFPQNKTYIENNVKLNHLEKRVILHNFGVYSDNHSHFLYNPTKHSESVCSFINDSAKENTTLITTKSLEECLNCSGKIPNSYFMKMDIEGSEYESIYNAIPSVFNHCIGIILEYHILDSEKRNGLYLKQYLESLNFYVSLTQLVENKTGILICTRS